MNLKEVRNVVACKVTLQTLTLRIKWMLLSEVFDNRLGEVSKVWLSNMSVFNLITTAFKNYIYILN